MDLNEYMEKAKTTAIYPDAGSGDIGYVLMGLISEVGEIAGKVLDFADPDKDEAHYCFMKILRDTELAGKVAGDLKRVIRDDEQRLRLCDTSKYDDVRFVEFQKQMIAEMGDVLWYLSQLAKELKTGLNVVGHENLKKLLSRKDRNAIKGSGDNR
jgi:NTP pyrophosphatase (non-canonical NTP hydrolase)